MGIVGGGGCDDEKNDSAALETKILDLLLVLFLYK